MNLYLINGKLVIESSSFDFTKKYKTLVSVGQPDVKGSKQRIVS